MTALLNRSMVVDMTPIFDALADLYDKGQRPQPVAVVDTGAPIYDRLARKYDREGLLAEFQQEAVAVYRQIGPVYIEWPEAEGKKFPEEKVRLNIARSLLGRIHQELPDIFAVTSDGEFQGFAEGALWVIEQLREMKPPEPVNPGIKIVGHVVDDGTPVGYGIDGSLSVAQRW